MSTASRGAAAVVRAAGRAHQRWRRSLRLRVITSALVVSLAVVALLAVVLLEQFTRGLLASQRKTAVGEASSGVQYAQATLLDLTADAEPDAVDNKLAELTGQLAARARAGTYDVALVTTATNRTLVSSNDVGLAEVPPTLRRLVMERGALAYAYTALTRPAGATPGLVVGSPLVTTSGRYELYFIFPLTGETQTLSLLRRTLLFGGLVLAILLAGIAAMVTRQVVTPVRVAAGIAERFAGGQLEARMAARGEDEIATLGRAFNGMAASLQQKIDQLQELSRVQRRFVADVSHELRTPLTTVRMAADVLHGAREQMAPAVARSAELLQIELDRFESLLVDLLEISRFDAGAAVLETEHVDLRRLVSRVVEALDPLAARRGSEVRLREDGEDLTVEADPRRVERILRNLVANAIEHGEGRSIEIDLRGDETAVAAVVRDHGVGLQTGEASRAFSRFWRGDPSRARHTGGTGLGLSIALEDARLHGGWLEAWGSPGEGSAFRLTLPRHVGAVLHHSPLPLQPPVRVAGG